MRQHVSSQDTTPTDQLFVYHIFGVPSEASRWQRDPASYRLTVGGLVSDELCLSLDELRTRFAPVTFPVVLQCMTNVHWGRIEVTGVPLAQVLEAAGVAGAATKVALRAADGFDTNLKMTYLAPSETPVLLAYQINGAPVPLEHGSPVRLVSPGRYGFKWPKWLVEVEAVDHDYLGHYEGKRGWSDSAERGRPVT